MQVNIGEKIRDLRKRDNRKQEDLANALGVTAQAVSRWESGGCFPDMNMIPAIANYFHVSIDSLFGYNNDRDSRIRELTAKYNRFFIDNDAGTTDLTEVIKDLRESLKEFPKEPELLRLLATALFIHGKKQSENPNRFLEEASEIYEEILKENDNVIFQILDLYSFMGDYKKAIEKAKEQPSLRTCRELLLASVNEGNGEGFAGKERKKYQGEAVLSLLHELFFILSEAVAKNEKTSNSKEGLKILLSVRDLYSAIFAEKDFGKFHSDMCMLNLRCADIAAQTEEYDLAFSCFDDAYNHYTGWEKQMAENRAKGCFEEKYTSSVLENAGDTFVPIVVIRPEYFESFVDRLPKDRGIAFRNILRKS